MNEIDRQNEIVPPDLPESGQRLEARQLRCCKILRDRDPRLEEMYLSVLFLLRMETIPDRFALAAHSMRELMEKILRWNRPSTSNYNLKVKVKELERHWLGLKRRSSSITSDSELPESSDLPSGAIEKYMRASEMFFDEFNKERPDGSEQFRDLMITADSYAAQIPDPVYKQSWKDIWTRLNNYFQAISHHDNQKTVEHVEFVRAVSEFEIYLLNMYPETRRVFDNMALIDSIIGEAEND